jgi:TonB family protein
MQAQSGPLSALKRIVDTFGHSAEYSIALGLAVVCLVVGGGLWLIKDGKLESSRKAYSSAQAAIDPHAEEKAVLEGIDLQLKEDFSKVEEHQRRIADEEAAMRERGRQETERVEREKTLERTAAAEYKLMQQASAPPPTPSVPARRASRSDASIDWSSCKHPVYPDDSARQGHEGTVSVAVDLDASGQVKASRVVSSSGHQPLDVTAQRAIEKCRFRPATADGVPQASSTEVRFTWKLR